MRHRELMMALVASSVVITPMAGTATPVEQPLAITETEDSFRLSVPVSRLVMTIPRGDFTVVHESGSGATASSRYFHFEDAPHAYSVPLVSAPSATSRRAPFGGTRTWRRACSATCRRPLRSY